ncbi:sulfite exporter TauE/SafE family protein [Litorivicinus sp.]|nr:sulfite exporter TauE/SafE family protein [Litorivicinus sp.]
MTELLNLDMHLAGFLFALLILWSGVGAGILVIPALIAVFHIEPIVAIASGSAFAFISKIMMTIEHAQQGSVDWRAAYSFLRVCLPVTLVTAISMVYLSDNHRGIIFEFCLIIAILLTGCLALSALLSARVRSIISYWPMITISGTTGLLMGLTGVGGGVMVVPALTTSGGLKIKVAVATSIPIGLILSLAVSITLGSSGLVDYTLVISLLIGAAIAIPLGTRLFHRFSENVIQHLTCGLISVALIDLAFEALKLSKNL